MALPVDISWTTKDELLSERKEVRWSIYNSHTSVNVCMHEIKTVSAPKWLPVWMCVCVLYFAGYTCMCSLYSIHICVSNCAAIKDINDVALNKKIVCLFYKKRKLSSTLLPFLEFVFWHSKAVTGQHLQHLPCVLRLWYKWDANAWS